MAGFPPPPTGLPPRGQMRPPPRAFQRAQPSVPFARGQLRSGTVSPTNSIASLPMSRPKSPTHQNGIKRKDRDFEADGGEETNIHVVVRCRGRSDREVRENSGVVVSTEGARGTTVELSMGPSALSNKTYHFDKVFSPAADQAMIYDDVVTPLLEEMLRGFNCTVFAYGQTGTGKTYTMSGDMSDTLGLLSDAAGIIPRMLHDLFRRLEGEDAESSVKCSFIELYNEELRDLLSVEETAKLKIFEDGLKKGHSATIVQGMEESHIKTAGEGIQLLQEGSHKRQVAATKCNDLSSRSHTVFTVTVYTKRTTESGEDFVSVGKLNLVDLAGSENIQRSGAENKRAAEAGLINKSLLTLGRVINALVDKGSHIPYRESKLTRLLQDSLGGRTKTCIIATVSPAKSNLEETISTLDYAFRAKNIRNKPQVNQMISKKTLLREFTAEIEKLKGELIATRQRNGVYLSNENYEEITVESESRRILSEEQRAKIETMEANLRNKVQELFSLTNNFAVLKKDNESTRQILDETTEILGKTEIVLANTRQNLADETLLRKAHQATEEELSTKGGELISTLDKTVKDVGGLHAKLRRRSDLQSVNRSKWTSTQSRVTDVTQLVESKVVEFQASQNELLSTMSSHVLNFVEQELQAIAAQQEALVSASDTFKVSETKLVGQASGARDEMNEVLEEIKVLRENVKRKVGEGLQGLSTAARRISGEVIGEMDRFHNQLQNSYSSLGRDFKVIFEELVKHLNTQQAEADELRKQLSVATAAATQADENISERLEACLAEEREQAVIDRQTLLSQISQLVNASGSIQDERMSSKIKAVRAEMATSRAEFRAASTTYNSSMDIWSKKESLVVEEVLKSRETLKGKLKQDWAAVNEHNTSIQTTTKSVHEETVRIVDAQVTEMASQMQALDDFVTRARSQNESHNKLHIESFNGLASSVYQSYSDSRAHLGSISGRIQAHQGAISAANASLAATLPSLDLSVTEPLSDLREAVLDAPLREYAPTGETPQKTQYSYPTSLPRTDAHETLLGKPARSRIGTTLAGLAEASASPTKSVVYTDTPGEDASLVRPSSMDGGIREIDVNIAGVLARPDAATAPTKSEAENLASSLMGLSASLMGPPPLKRQATETRLPQKHGGGRAGVVRIEGRENVAPGPRGRRMLRSSTVE